MGKDLRFTVSVDCPQGCTTEVAVEAAEDRDRDTDSINVEVPTR